MSKNGWGESRRQAADLHEAAHNAVAEEELIAAERHCGDDGVVRAFAALHVQII